MILGKELECNSREGIIDFIEKSQNLSSIRQHYSSLLIHKAFEKSLKDIARLKVAESRSCLIVHWSHHKEFDSFLIDFFKDTFLSLGISVSVEMREKTCSLSQLIHEPNKEDYIFYISSFADPGIVEGDVWVCSEDQTRFFISFRNTNYIEDVETLLKNNFINLEKQKSIYFIVFEILKKLFPKVDFKHNWVDFKTQHEVIIGEAPPYYTQHNFEKKKIKKKEKGVGLQINQLLTDRKWQLISFVFSISLLSLAGIAMFQMDDSWKNKEKRNQFQNQLSYKRKEVPAVRVDLAIPTGSAFLDRSELISQINEKFKDNDEIQTLALIGTGGAGKTTLARQYARLQKADVVWEINAETHDSLISSFEHLAQALAITEEDKKVLREIEEIKDSAKKEENILQFTKDHLKLCTNWFLIYDNVEKFTDINEYFPYDKNVWGQGRVLLTTRDNTIQNSKYVPYAIVVGELTLPQKLTFFQQIMNQGNINPLTPLQQEEIKTFLNQIPSFPLDIAVAAYYLKTTNISYDNYLERLNENNKDFSNTQKNILKDANGYNKTRYGIITLSVKNLIETHKDFLNLLLLISLINSQNIPRDLLEKCKNDAVVDSFIYNLKKYSLITNEQPPSSSLGATFSIHRSTQAISLAYLLTTLGLEKNKQLIHSSSDIFLQYIKNISP